MPRKLFFGSFNYQGEVHTFYRYAGAESQARLFMLKALADKLKLSFVSLRGHFSGNEDNYMIKEHKK